MKKILLILFVMMAMLPADIYAKNAKLINDYAGNALNRKNYSEKGGVVKLYGTRTNGPDTDNGRLACAKVVTIVLKKTGAIDKIRLGVRHVEADLKKWNKINREQDLKPGDVVVWMPLFAKKDGYRCTGGGDCHVGIVTNKGYFHNNPLTNKPTFGGVALWFLKFKTGFRPPKPIQSTPGTKACQNK